MNILILDIETAPAVAYVWGTFKENIPLERVIRPGRMICWAAKWHGDKKVVFGSEWGSDFISDLWQLLDEADVVVSYNGKTFDIPRINAAFLEQGLGPPSPYFHVDLYQTVRTKFKFISGKLDYLVRHLDLGGKAHTGGFATWRGVDNGDPKAQRRMERYNKEDVRITERLYDVLRPWISNHPNKALIDGASEHVCPTCGSSNLQKRGLAYTKVSAFQRYLCNNCGTYSRSGRREESVDLRQVR